MCGLELDVPNLEVLEYGYICPHKILCNFKSLRAARIYAGLDREENGEKDIITAAFVAACSSTVYLRLATTTIDALQHSPTQLPVFQNLTTLALGRVMKSEGWMLLAHLLLHTPNHEKLMFEKWFDELDIQSLRPYYQIHQFAWNCILGKSDSRCSKRKKMNSN